MNALLVQPLQPIDAVESSLIHSWQEVSRATHRFLALLREFDLRQGWKAYGNNDCAEWLDWRCGIARTTAQEKVRVANSLWLLRQIDEAFRQGRLSYSKVRALTRVATENNETDLLAYALGATAAQLEDHCRRLRNGDAAVSTADANHLHEGRALIRHLRADGSGTLTVSLPGEALELVCQALAKVAASLPDDPGSSLFTPSLFAREADALVQMARESLLGARETQASGTDGSEGQRSTDAYQVVVHVDAAALQGRGGKSDLPVESVRRLCCDASVVGLTEGASDAGNSEPLNVGRKQRTVPTAIKRALLARDRTCTFPGCHHTRFLDAHHIHHWAQGGETRLDNLLTLCSTHHRLIHEGGFRIQRRRQGGCYFVRPDGRPVEQAPPAISSSAEGRAFADDRTDQHTG